MSSERWVIIKDDGTLVLHTENDDWAFLRHGPEARETPITLDELANHSPNYEITVLQLAGMELARRREEARFTHSKALAPYAEMIRDLAEAELTRRRAGQRSEA
jgi:hypothetical protein